MVEATAAHMELSFILRIVFKLKLRVLNSIKLYLIRLKPVSYTHLTLPTNREV